MAFEHLEVPQTVTHVSLTRADNVGSAVKIQAQSLLEPYTGEGQIFTDAQVEAYANRRYAEGVEEYLAKRIAGEDNDKYSSTPGITALIIERAKTRIEQILCSDPQRSFIYEPEFELVEDTVGEDQLFIMRLRQGGYSEMATTVLFTDIVEQHGREVRPHATDSTSVHADLFEVVTIAGDGGEYWQSRFMNPDGTNSAAS